MNKHSLPVLLTLLLAGAASAQSCIGLAKDSAAYQTCMLRVENNRRENAAEEKAVADQKQRKQDKAERQYSLLVRRMDLARELNKVCAADPTEECAIKSGILQKIEALKAESDSL